MPVACQAEREEGYQIDYGHNNGDEKDNKTIALILAHGYPQIRGRTT
jgi:hypothetical protein